MILPIVTWSSLKKPRSPKPSSALICATPSSPFPLPATSGSGTEVYNLLTVGASDAYLFAGVGGLLAIFYVLDRINFNRAPRAAARGAPLYASSSAVVPPKQ